MEILNVNYSTWKNCFNANSTWDKFHREIGTTSKILYTGHKDTCLKTTIDQNDHTDWATNYSNNSLLISNEDDALAYLLFLDQKNIPRAYDEEGKQKVTSESIIGAEKFVYSPNFCDRCSWWEGSTFIENFQLTHEATEILTYKTFHTNNTHLYWIDLAHGRINDEDSITEVHTTLIPVIEKSTNSGSSWISAGVEDTDFSIDYPNGKIVFVNSVGSSTLIRASFHKENEFLCTVQPDEGMQLKMVYCEAQMSTDIKYKANLVTETWVYNPFDPPNKILYKKKVHKNVMNMMQEAVDPPALYPAIGGTDYLGQVPRFTSNDTATLKFNYLAIQPMKNSQGVELRFKIKNNIPFQGEWGNATFYCIQQPEI